MRRYHFNIMCILITGSLAVSSCNKEEDNNNTLPCDQIWTAENNVGAAGSISVTNGELILSSDNTPTGVALRVFRDDIIGDFDATFAFENFQAGDSVGGFVQMFASVIGGAPDNLCGAHIGNTPFPVIGAAIDSSGSNSTFIAFHQTINTSGTFRISRVGSTVTVTTVAGNDIATTTDGFGAGNVRLGLKLGSSAPLSGTTSIHIKSFTVTGGGSEANSDTFDCDSVE